MKVDDKKLDLLVDILVGSNSEGKIVAANGVTTTLTNHPVSVNIERWKITKLRLKEVLENLI